ncbi:hypothetical protein ACTA71_008032 [Dictyostelium dimigraforme]
MQELLCLSSELSLARIDEVNSFGYDHLNTSFLKNCGLSMEELQLLNSATRSGKYVPAEIVFGRLPVTYGLIHDKMPDMDDQDNDAVTGTDNLKIETTGTDVDKMEEQPINKSSYKQFNVIDSQGSHDDMGGQKIKNYQYWTF